MAKAYLRILFLNDRLYASNLVETLFLELSPVPIRLHHVSELRQALSELSDYSYNMVFIDHYLARKNTVREMVSALHGVKGQVPLVLLTSDSSENYLSCPQKIGVDHIIDKADPKPFIQSIFDGRLRGTVCDVCVFSRKNLCLQVQLGTGHHNSASVSSSRLN